jgi:hemolysin type calcium-binding protein
MKAALAGIGAAGALVCTAAAAAADTYTVTNTNDPGPGSLRQAIAQANAHPGFDSIVFTPGLRGTIELTQGELSVQSGMEIRGPGPSDLAVSGGRRTRVLNVSRQPQGNAIISGLTITQGFVHADDGGDAGDAGASGTGGGILNQGSLSLTNVQVTGNRIEGGNGANGTSNPFGPHSGGPGGNAFGGGIFSNGSLDIRNSEVAGNVAVGGFGGDAPRRATLHAGEGGSGWGGGIRSEGRLTVTNSRIDGNTAAGGEGGNDQYEDSRGRRGGEGNGAGLSVGGTTAVGDPVRLTGVTVDGNRAQGGPGPYGGWAYGAGIRIDLNGALEMTDSTVSGNRAIGGDGNNPEPRPQHVQGGGILNRVGSLTIENSTVSGNSVKGGNRHNEFSTIAGGGIGNLENAFLALTNSTISGNSAEVGGGIDNRDGGTNAVLTADTLAKNEGTSPGSGANFANSGGAKALVETTIVAEPRGSASCANPSARSFGYNLDQDGSCGLAQGTDLRNVNPQLEDLKQNGGPTKTQAIPRSSPALDQGKSEGLRTDQRGMKRPVSFGIVRPPGGDGADIGAFELQGGNLGNPTCAGKRPTILAANVGRTVGTQRRDVIEGTPRPDTVLARRSADVICGRTRADRLHGQRGPDRIRGGRGSDRIRSGRGQDRIHDVRGRNSIKCGPGFDTVITNRRSAVAPSCESVTRR